MKKLTRRLRVGLALVALVVMVTAFGGEVDIVKTYKVGDVTTAVQLKFSTAVSTQNFNLYYAYGFKDGGKDGTNGWANVAHCGLIPAGTTSIKCELPTDAYAPNDWNGDKACGRFFAICDDSSESNYTADSYTCTTEGAELIAQWDGLEGTKTASAWTDRIGGKTINFYGNVAMTDVGYVFPTANNDNYGLLGADDSTAVFGGDAITVEVVIRDENSGNYILLMTPKDCLVGFGRYNSALVAAAVYDDRGFNFSHTGGYSSFAITYEGHKPITGWQNGGTLAANGTPLSWSGEVSETYIGQRGTGTLLPFKGTIYSIRVYRGILRDADIFQHDMVDAARFNMGVKVLSASDLLVHGMLWVKSVQVDSIELDQSGKQVAANLSFAGAMRSDCALYVAYGDSDGGETTNGWTVVEKLAELDSDLTTMRFVMPNGWGENYHFLRFFVYERSGYTANDYTQTELLANWDGEDFTGTDTWIDRVSNRAFTLTDVTRSDDLKALVFNGTSSRGTLTVEDSTATFNSVGDKTVEVVVKMMGGLVLKSSAASGIAFGHIDNAHLSNFSSNGERLPIYSGFKNLNDGRNAYSVTYQNARPTDRCYQTGYLMWQDGNPDYFGGDPETTCLGWRSDGNGFAYFTGEICAVRLYSKCLTSQEMSHNVAIDRQRFLGVTPTILATEVIVCPRPIVIAKECRESGRVVAYDLEFGGKGMHPAILYSVAGEADCGVTTNGWGHVTAIASILPEDTSLANVPVPESYRTGESKCFRYVLVEDYAALTPATYAAQDALVACWDARERGSDNTQWPDLVAGRTFALTNPNWDDSEGRLVFDGNCYGDLSAADAQEIMDALTNECMTLECTMQADNQPSIFVKTPTSMGMCIAFWPYFTAASSTHDCYAISAFGSPILLSMNYVKQNGVFVTDGGYENGEALGYYGKSDSCGQEQDGIKIGRRSNGNPCPANGFMNSLRFYNRVLTDAERARNFYIDQYRFGWKFAPFCDGVSASPCFSKPGMVIIFR